MNLSEMRGILARADLQLTKSLGQNFLHDANQLRRIVAAAELTKGDQVLEIGPGLGPLTELLIAQAGRVRAIEKDFRLYKLLKEHLAQVTNLDLEPADALRIVKDRALNWHDWKLVANLPYSVGTVILVELAQNPHRPAFMVATLQKEVVQRIAARPDTDDYGLLSLLIQLRYEVREWFGIPRTCFFPEPDVDSACVTLLRRATPLLEEKLHESFEALVRRSFSQRRKMMFKLLKAGCEASVLRAAFQECKLDEKIRAEKVTLEQFVMLTLILNSGSGSPVQNS